MEQYIKKSALVSEIEKRRSKNAKNKLNLAASFEDNYLLSFIDTLEIKGVDLEEKATQLSQKYFPDEENIWARPNIEAHNCKSACIEMVEWFKAQKGE
jgi:hypothetical protein